MKQSLDRTDQDEWILLYSSCICCCADEEHCLKGIEHLQNGEEGWNNLSNSARRFCGSVEKPVLCRERKIMDRFANNLYTSVLTFKT